MSDSNIQSNLIEAIPPAKSVRDRIDMKVREVQLLRQLLRLAERAERANLKQAAVQGGQHAAAAH